MNQDQQNKSHVGGYIGMIVLSIIIIGFMFFMNGLSGFTDGNKETPYGFLAVLSIILISSWSSFLYKINQGKPIDDDFTENIDSHKKEVHLIPADASLSAEETEKLFAYWEQYPELKRNVTLFKVTEKFYVFTDRENKQYYVKK